MGLRDRKAFALLAAYLGSVDRTMQPTEGELASLWKSLTMLADNAGFGEPLDAWLNESTERGLKFALGRQPTPAASAAANALKARIAGLHCKDCTAGEICNGGDEDDAIIAAEAGGRCIWEIKTAFEDAEMAAAQIYAGALTDHDAPTHQLNTTGLTDAPSSVPGVSLSLNGMTLYSDGPQLKQAQIHVRIAAAALNPFTLSALPYVLLHEVVCHGYQMARSPDPRPNRGAVVDPVSEGMMDLLVVERLEAQAREQIANPGDDAHARALAARQVHLARRSLDQSPRFPEAPQVALGVAAFESARMIFEAEAPGSGGALAERLARDLNLHPWRYVERLFGLTRLVSGLRPPRAPDLVERILTYAHSGDADVLVESLLKQ